VITNYNDFLAWAQNNRDPINFNNAWIDIANSDVIAEIVFTKLIHWYLPEQGESKPLFSRDGNDRIAVTCEEWWHDCLLTLRQADRTLNMLMAIGLVKKKLSFFKGRIVTHLLLYSDVLMTKLSKFYKRSL